MDEWRPVLPTAEKIKSQKGFLIVLGLLGAAIVAGTWAQSGTPALGIMIVVAGTGFMSLVMHRRVRIEINRQGLRIRGGGSRTFGWGEIAEITTAPSTLLGGDTCWPAVWIVTTDGERIQTKAVRWDQNNRSELPPSKSKLTLDPVDFDQALDVLQQALSASRA